MNPILQSFTGASGVFKPRPEYITDITLTISDVDPWPAGEVTFVVKYYGCICKKIFHSNN